MQSSVAAFFQLKIKRKQRFQVQQQFQQFEYDMNWTLVNLVTVIQALARSHQDHRANIGKLTKTTPCAAPVPPETSTSPTASADQQI